MQDTALHLLAAPLLEFLPTMAVDRCTHTCLQEMIRKEKPASNAGLFGTTTPRRLLAL